MYHDEIPERCKLNFTGIVDDALRTAGELFPKQTLKKYIRKEVEIDTDGRVRSRRFEKKRKVAERFKEMPFLKAKRHRAHSVVSGVRVKFYFHLAAPAREDCVLLLAACHNGYPDCPLSATVRLPFFLSMDTRGESETYKKDGTDKDYTTNTQRFNIS
ncbi:hypothetical protein TNCV_4184591 [Trichonephila clavipes]|nr:hypothetical protein TNCV_4184591 [Trichonephila clavipes]